MDARRIVCGVLLAWLWLAAACGQSTRAGEEGNTMKASTTYLYLLRKTPFFTGLDTQQLRWTIDHSREWEAQPDTVIAECGGADDFWILLDGRWQVERDGRAFPAGHADAGKWFSASEGGGACRLVTTEHSYVMKIARADMDDMLARGFAFGSHLQQGRAYYATIFAATAAVH
ncbi:hypothetical protein P3T23_004694 [Paraburkholderia sp. GAS448]|uniref:hypothetical protein n=1 Tax=Paraburkholderia sp. GAS448 TaxID=3035136 RepID=UPI003D1CB9A1